MKTTLDQHLAKKIIEPKDIAKKVAELRREGKTIATLNGSFDLLHAGHLEIIYQASLVADVLIMALNTDASIKAYKSPSRPFVELKDRLRLIAALEFVSYVTWFDELDPRAILSVIKPDWHVNGAEYGANCIEAETVRQNGGQIQIVSLVPGLSTSKLVEKIINSKD